MIYSYALVCGLFFFSFYLEMQKKKRENFILFSFLLHRNKAVYFLYFMSADAGLAYFLVFVMFYYHFVVSFLLFTEIIVIIIIVIVNIIIIYFYFYYCHLYFDCCFYKYYD